MALNSLSPLMIFSLLIAAASLFGSSSAFGGRKALSPGPAAEDDPAAEAPSPIPDDLGFTPLNSKDPKVMELAKFAVEEYNKSNKANLVLYSVMEAIATDKDGGIEYGFVVATTKDNELTSYHFDVFVSNNVKKLTASEPI